MAKPNKPPIGSRFQKGCPGGPGRTPVPVDQKEAWKKVQEMRAVASVAFQEKLEKYQNKSVQELLKLQKDHTLPADDMVMVKAFIRAANVATLGTLTTLRTLAAGPEVKQVELSGPGGEPLHPLANVPDAELIATYQEVQLQIRERQCKSTPKPQQLLEPSAQLSLPQSPTEP